MEKDNIERNISELFNGDYKYIVPLYQRNFAWTDREVTQLLQDIYENFKLQGSDKNYFVGSIIYIRRNDGSLEIIDGQQRLTAFTLLLKILEPDIKEFHLDYDSREEVTCFLKYFYGHDSWEYDDCGIASTDVTENFINAVNTMKYCNIDSQDDNITIETLRKNHDKYVNFIRYVKHNIYFVLAEMPSDTDVATYFEIMNNTGEQLKKHEIVKSLIMGNPNNKLTDSQMKCFSKVWDACSQMELRIEYLSNSSVDDRILIFGPDYDNIHLDKIEELTVDNSLEEESSVITDIIKESKYNAVEKKNDDEDDVENKGNSIIDFPNFLMHVFRLLYNEKYLEKQGTDIPLNDKYLQNVYYVINDEIHAMDFISHLLYYRIVLDRFVVRVSDNIEGGKWEINTLKKRKDSYGFESTPTFSKSDKIIKAVSMLQVSYPQMKYKNFLFEILSWFSYGRFNYDSDWYLTKLNKLILRTFDDVKGKYDDGNMYCLGMSTPRFLLNFIDYLYYYKQECKPSFDFRYYNSVEHHCPRSSEMYKKFSADVIDSIGNLFLISKRINSSLNDNDPISKVNKVMATHQSLPPNRKIIYERTSCNNHGWGEDDIKKHEVEIRNLIDERFDLLSFNEISENNLLYRAMLSVNDYTEWNGSACGGDKYYFGHDVFIKNKDIYNKILNWRKLHLDKTLEDFIKERLDQDERLNSDDWRKVFVKYSSVMKYCRYHNFAWVDEGNFIYLLPNKRRSIGARELRSHLLFEKLNDYRVVSSLYVNYYGLYIDLKDIPFVNSFPKAMLSLHLWVGKNAEMWCYELCSGRRQNALENQLLLDRGWLRNNDGGYYKENMPVLCECGVYNIEESVDIAFEEVKKLLAELETY